MGLLFLPGLSFSIQICAADLVMVLPHLVQIPGSRKWNAGFLEKSNCRLKWFESDLNQMHRCFYWRGSLNGSWDRRSPAGCQYIFSRRKESQKTIAATLKESSFRLCTFLEGKINRWWWKTRGAGMTADYLPWFACQKVCSRVFWTPSSVPVCWSPHPCSDQTFESDLGRPESAPVWTA